MHYGMWLVDTGVQAGVGSSSELSRVLCRFRAEVSREYMKGMRQTIIVELWGGEVVEKGNAYTKCVEANDSHNCHNP